MKIEAHNTTSTLAEAAQAKAEARLLLEENGLLRQALADAGKCIDADDVIDALDAVDEYAEALGTQAARIAELEAALRFYADDENWRHNGQLDPNSGNFTGGPARAALEGGKS